MKSYAAVLHNTLGLQPGYLPQDEALATLSGALHLLTLASHLEQRAATLKKEALGRVMVALAGSPPNCFYQLLEAFFSYKEATSSEAASTAADTTLVTELKEEATPAPSPAVGSQIPQHLKPAATLPAFTSGSESESRQSSKLSPEATNAIGFKPLQNPDLWTDTGLAKEYIPKLDAGGSDYQCPFPSCDRRSVAQKDTMSTHIRRDHLNIAVGCHYCDKLFWSREGWGKHCARKHLGVPAVPLASDTSIAPTPAELLTTLQTIHKEESKIHAETAPLPQLQSAEPELVLTDEEIMVID